MDILTFISELVKACVWPLTLLVIVFIFRKRISDLFGFIESIKYKEIEILFRKQLDALKIEAQIADFPPSDNISREDLVLAENNPVQLVLKAWIEVEEVALSRLKILLPKSDKHYEKLSRETAVRRLLFSGALSPSSNKLLENLNHFRNQVVHAPSFSISTMDALDYLSLTLQLRKQIEVIPELPAMKLTALTLLISEINHLIDTEKYDTISIDDVEKEIKQGSILQYLHKMAKDDIDLSVFLESDTYHGFEDFYVDTLQRTLNAYGGNENRKWGVKNRGLCLLLAWTNEIIQQGSGWYPNE